MARKTVKNRNRGKSAKLGHKATKRPCLFDGTEMKPIRDRSLVSCGFCKGTGLAQEQQADGTVRSILSQACTTCNGEGLIETGMDRHTCPTCSIPYPMRAFTVRMDLWKAMIRYCETRYEELWQMIIDPETAMKFNLDPTWWTTFRSGAPTKEEIAAMRESKLRKVAGAVMTGAWQKFIERPDGPS